MAHKGELDNQFLAQEAVATDVDRIRTPVLLGDLLARRGLVTSVQLAQALELQRQLGGRLGTNLVELGILTEEEIARCLSEHVGIPYFGADAVANIAAETIARVPTEVARRFRCVPLFADGATIRIGVADHAAIAEIVELATAVGAEVSLALLTELALGYALDRYYGIRREVRGVQFAGIIDAYRWLSDASGRLSACRTLSEIVTFLGEALTSRLGSSTSRVWWAEGGSLVIRDDTGSHPIEPDTLPIEVLRTQSRPQVLGTALLCPIRDPGELRAVISLEGIEPAYGDIELVQVLLESTAHAIGLVETRAKVATGARLAETLGRYVSGSVVEELKRDQELVLFGRKQELSILFADIRGFTTLSENLDPDLTVLVLNLFFGEMSAAIAKFAGTLDKFIGDGLMAFWGAPTAVPDHAALAARAASEMQLRMPRVNRKIRRLQIDNADALTIGVGICTGMALVGNMGTRQLMQYTAIGDAVNVAARLCSKADRGEILVDDRTAALVLPGIRCDPRGPLVVKGRAEPVLVHSIVASE